MKVETIKFTNYQEVELIHQSEHILVYRAIAQKNNQPVVIKLMKNEYPSFNELIQFRNQYVITKNLEIEGIIKSYSLEQYENRYALIMEDMGGISLAEYEGKASFSLQLFLNIAIQLSKIVHQLHNNSIIHKDIKPANILIDPETQAIKLIDFSISTLLPRENKTIQTPNVLEGTLAYISPEQTGRMNRGIDYRSDFYSLGVTFYELLTGKLPFNYEDPLELIHAHIAEKPKAIGDICPQAISDIVLKLMAKNAEDRYQNVLGLKYDLEKCLGQYQEKGKIEPFELGERDRSDRFNISEKLYGREKEVAQLLAAFDRISQNGDTNIKPTTPKSELMLVAGFSGIGKTAVIKEIHKPIVHQRGYFIKGKFDQFNRNIPFNAFVQAFRDLMDQLLCESSIQLENWKQKILEALGDNAQVIIEVIPELKNIIGEQPSVPELSGNAAQNRFNLLFSKFICVFTTKDHPLVIFLDDLQWADLASLNLLKLLMDESEISYLLVLGAYRNNEVDSSHPLILTLDEIQKQGAVINTLNLTPLGEKDINRLVADTLQCSLEVAMPLSQLISQKTQGNPFFTTQFLKGLYSDGWITFAADEGYWQCDWVQVKQLALTSDVVDFMVSRLYKLPKTTQEVLKLAACIGNQFDLATLAIVCESTQERVATDLWRGLQEGFVIPKSETYKFFQGEAWEEQRKEEIAVQYRFLHDRVQQAAYTLISEDQKQGTHLAIGRLLWQNASEIEREENLFAIVNQLNIGIPLLDQSRERKEIAQLNLDAAQKAKSSAAYAAAESYLKNAILLLGKDSNSSEQWQINYALMLKLHNILAEVSYLNGNFEAAQQLIQTILNQTTNLLDRVTAYEIRISLLVAQGNCQAALDVGLEILSLLDVSLDDAPLPNIDIDHLYTLPAIADRKIASALDILSKLWAPAFIANSQLLPKVILTMLNLSVTYGNSATGAFAYALYGMLLCAMMKDIELGYRFGELALHILEQYEDAKLTCKVNQLFHAFIRNWRKPARDQVECLADNVLTGLETGDIEFACYSAINYCDNLCLIGESLKIIYDKQTYYIDLIAGLQQEFQFFAALIWGQFVENLRGMASDPKQLIGKRFNEYEEITKIQNSKAFSALFFLYTSKTILHYLFDDWEGALTNAKLGTPYEEAGGGLYPITQIPLYRSLALLAIYPTANPKRQAQILKEVEIDQQRLRIWATNAPENFQHKLDLVKGEKYRILGEKAQAIDYYDLAIAGAKENGYLHEEALANELAAKFYLNWGKKKIAKSYLQDAYYCYNRWGAKAKVEHLKQKYPQLLENILQSTNSEITSEEITDLTKTITTHGKSFSSKIWLDFPAILKASQVISQDIQLEKLLETLMQIAITNAGAQIGHLLLYQDEQWVVVAQADKDHSQMLDIPLNRYTNLPQSVIYSVARTHKTSVFKNLSEELKFAEDIYIATKQPQSVLCMPINRQGKIIGILYLENNLAVEAFTYDRVEILQLLTSQAAISLENARLYQKIENYSYTLETEVERKTKSLNQKAQDLEQTLKQLQHTQAQLIQSEKMSSLGQLVAGIAHEINNPISFITGNILPTQSYIEELIELIELYQEEYSQPSEKIKDKCKEIDINFLFEDATKILESMKKGSDRIHNIILSLRDFSRLDQSEIKTVDLHSGIESTLLILRHRFQKTEDQPEVKLIKKYEQLPKVTCYPSQLNQVFLNIINNALDAIQEAPQNIKTPIVEIRTEMLKNNQVRIIITNTGNPIPEMIKDRIFDPFFTTKPVGHGTGLGLFVSYSIIQKHGGTISLKSTIDKGTTFTINIPISKSASLREI